MLRPYPNSTRAAAAGRTGGRPKPAGDAASTYTKWLSFYRDKVGLGPVLGAGLVGRSQVAPDLCGFAFSRYAYELGNDLVLLKHGNDEVSGIIGGLAMLPRRFVQARRQTMGRRHLELAVLERRTHHL